MNEGNVVFMPSYLLKNGGKYKHAYLGGNQVANVCIGGILVFFLMFGDAYFHRHYSQPLRDRVRADLYFSSIRLLKSLASIFGRTR